MTPTGDDPELPTITERYVDYEPPWPIRDSIARMLATVPARDRLGLDEVVLTTRASLPHDRRRKKTRARGRKVRIAECRGLYHGAHKGQRAWIELFVDNLIPVDRFPRPLRFLLEAPLAETFFHELGHHAHATSRPEHREREDVADAWSKRWTWRYLRRRYWYLVPVFWLLRVLHGPIKRYSQAHVPGESPGSRRK